jgi:hypothetical protein
MRWPPERKRPAPVIRPDTGLGRVEFLHLQISRSQRGAQDHRRKARAKFAKDAVFSEFGCAGRALANPLDWLRGGATGICVVDWKLDPDRLLYGAGKIVADSQDLRRRLRKRIVENALARHDLEVGHAA